MPNKYIQRRLIKADKLSSKSEGLVYHEDVSLYQLIKEGSKRIVLLGEAGSGKSTELENNFKVLYAERNHNQAPIIIPLNTYTGDNFMQYVSMKLRESASILLEYSRDKLVFFFDEFDQVVNKKSATRQIINFIDH